MYYHGTTFQNDIIVIILLLFVFFFHQNMMGTFSFLDRMLNISSRIRIKHQTLRKEVLYTIESKIIEIFSN